MVHHRVALRHRQGAAQALRLPQRARPGEHRGVGKVVLELARRTHEGHRRSLDRDVPLGQRMQGRRVTRDERLPPGHDHGAVRPRHVHARRRHHRSHGHRQLPPRDSHKQARRQ